MRYLYNPQDWADLLIIMSDYEASDVAVDIGGYLGDYIPGRPGRYLDVSDRLKDGDYSISSDSVAWSFSGNISGYLPSKLRNAPLRLYADFDGITVPLFEGHVSLPVPNDDYTTQVVSATPGSLLDKISLRRFLEFSQMTPEQIVRAALYMIPLYDRANIRIVPFGQPLMDFLGDDGFEDQDTPMAILSAVMDQVEYFYQDTPIGRGHRADKDVGTGEGIEPVWEYDAENGREVLSWTDPAWATPDEQYSSVVVRKKEDDGTYTVWEEVPVFYPGLEYPPVGDQISWIDWDGDSGVGAHERAVTEARTLGAGKWKLDTTVAFNPFYDEQDVIKARSTYEDDTGYYERHWRAVVEGVQQNILGDALSTDLSCRAYLLGEERLPDPPIILHGVSAGVVAYDELTLLFEETAREGIIHSSVSWAEETPTEVVLLTGAPVVSEDAREIVLADEIEA